MTKQTLSIVLLGTLLWASQLVFAMHEFDHLGGQDGQNFCEICLAASGLGHAAAAPAQPSSLPAAAVELATLQTSLTCQETYLAVPARGPPLSVTPD